MNADEAARLVLQLAQPEHVVHAVTRLLDMAVEHRARRAQPLGVGQPVDTRPVLPVGVVVDDLLADLPVKDLRTAAGQRLEAAVNELVEDLVGGQAGDLLEPVDLGGGGGLERDLGQRGLQLAQAARVVAPRQRRVQAVDDVQLGDALGLHLPRQLDGLLDAHRVGLGLAGLALEGAVRAARGADVREVEVAVDVEVTRSPFLRVRTSCARPPSQARSSLSYRARPSSKVSRSPASTFASSSFF